MERVWSTSLGGYSVRSILIFVLAVISTVLLWAVIGSTPAHAAEANWKGDSIIYDTRQYFPLGEATAGASHGLPVGTQIYQSTEIVDQNTGARKAYVIYFAPGTSPPTETTADYVEYDFAANDTYSNPQNSQTISITVRGAESSYSSCSVEGIGWFICPVTVFLADAMDSLFLMVAGFVAVQPIPVNDTTSPLYISWSVMLNIANVAFIIMGLIIIYSQVTGIGISNYGIKKLLPRLFITAILVNLSFYITAIAVDLSNIAGFSLQDILIRIRQDTFAITGQTWSDDTTTWANITGLVLSGGAVVAGSAALSTATAGSIPAALYMLVPLLIGLVLTILFVLLILAARQAIIVILIVISPLAFVANLLPNTEKWFEKWRDLFLNMLIFFPAFALVFGGSQLAGGIIIQNANNIVMMLFGMAVQVAPLVITPLILKLSGGILGRIAGLINDPRKGMLDRSKHWANDRQNMHKQKSLSQTQGIKRLNPFRRVAQRFDNGNRYVKEQTANYEKQSENRYMDTRKHQRAYEQSHDADTDRKAIEGRLERDLYTRMASNPTRYAHSLRAANMTDEAAVAKQAYEASMKEAKAGSAPSNMTSSADIRNLVSQAQRTAAAAVAQSNRDQAAETALQRNIAEAFNVELKADGSNQAQYIASQALLRTAGGIQGQAGITRAQSNAAATLTKLNKEALENNMSLLTDRAVLSNQTPKSFAMSVLQDRIDGNFTQPDEVVKAAMEIAGDEAQIPMIRKLRMSNHINQSDVTEMLIRKSSIMKAKGGFDLQNDTALAGVTQQRMNASVAATLGSTASTDFPGMKNGAIKEYAETISAIITDSAAETDPQYHKDAINGLKKTYSNLTDAFRNPDVLSAMGDNLEYAIDIHKALHAKYGDASRVIDYDSIDPRKI